MSKRDSSGDTVTADLPGLSIPACPYPATKMDLCPQAVMTWRNRRAVCDFAHAAHGSGDTAILCFSPHRVLRAPLDATSQAETYAATSRRDRAKPAAPKPATMMTSMATSPPTKTGVLSGVPYSWKTERSATQDGHRKMGASSNRR